MKLFAMLMLRCALIMHLSSLFQNGTLANLEEWDTSCHKLEQWKKSCHLWVNVISISLGSITSDDLSNIPNINHSLDVLLYEVNKFPIEGMDELLDRRLQKPLKMAIVNCNKLLNEVEHSGREDNNKNLENLLSKTSSIAKGIRTEFNTFIFEVELELIKKVKWTSGNRNKLATKFSHFCTSAQQIESYCNPGSFSRAFLWVSGMGGPQPQPGTPQFVEYLGILILNAKLNILKRELHAKIAGFVEQQHFDWTGFMEFSHNFKREWNQIEQQIDQVNNHDLASTMERYRTELNDLAQNAMEETAQLKGIITKMLDQLVTKCYNAKLDGPVIGTKEKSPLKDRIRRWLNGLLEKCLRNKKEISLNSAESQHQQPTDTLLNKETQIEAKNNELNAKKDIISDIGMFDGEAYKVLVRFEHEELDSNDFCAELGKAVEQDKEMVLQAYQVKDKSVVDE